MGFFDFIKKWVPTSTQNVVSNSIKEETPQIKKGKATPPSSYKLVFEDNFTKRFLDKTKWIPSQPWGEFHSSYPYKWWPKDETALSIENDILRLDLRYFPKTFTKHHPTIGYQKDDLPDKFTINHAAGLVRTKDEFKFGWFEADIKLPKQQNQWVNFGLMSGKSPLPEISILESFSPPSDVKVISNVYYGDPNTPKSLNIEPTLVKSPTDRFANYACYWTEEFINFYVDGYLVRSITDKEVLEELSGSSQYLFLSNGLQKDPKNFKYYGVVEIKNVKIYQNEGTILS
jgi:beta-glucanase (GH16 family)